MSVTQQVEKLPVPEKSPNVIIGRQDFFSTLLRTIGGELYKIRRRAMSKVLALIALVVVILAFVVFVFLQSIITLSQPAESFLPPACNDVYIQNNIPCRDREPTADELKQAEKTKQEVVKTFSAGLRLPGSISQSVGSISFIGTIVIIILAGTIVGGEYSVGSIRLLLTRGPSRIQYVLSKMGTILASAFLLLVVLLIVGIITGALLNLAIGIPVDFAFFSAGWLGHTSVYVLVALLGLFVYGTMAIFLATLGRATAAGVAGALSFWFVENIAGSILRAIGQFQKNWFGDLLKAIPDYFPGANISALGDNQLRYISGEKLGTISDVHALLVILVYLSIMIGLTLWIQQTRDVTN